MSLKQSHSYGIISNNNNLNNNISKKNRSIIYRPSNQSVKFLFNNFEVFKF